MRERRGAFVIKSLFCGYERHNKHPLCFNIYDIGVTGL